MTSFISWIDHADLAETLARFGSSGGSSMRRPRPPIAAPPLDPTRRIRSSLAPFEIPSGSLRDRLDGFIDWLLRIDGGNVAFVIDRDGLPLVDRGAEADLLAIASSVIQLVEGLNRKLLAVIGRSVTLQLEEGLLVLISATTPIGDYTIGHVSHRTPDPAAQQTIAEALRAAFESGERLAFQ